MSSEKTVFQTTTSSGNTVSVTQNPQLERQNPVADIADTLITGQIPKNQQIHATLDKATQILDSQKTQLNPQGNTLASDTQQLIDATKRLMVEKNDDGLLQNVILQSKQATQENVSNTGVQSAVSDAYGYIRTLAVELLKSAEMRTVSNEVIQLLLSMFGTKNPSNHIGTTTAPFQSTPSPTTSLPVPIFPFQSTPLQPNPLQPTPFQSAPFQSTPLSTTVLGYQQNSAATDLKRNKVVDSIVALISKIGASQQLRASAVNLFQLLDLLLDRSMWNTNTANSAIRDARRLLERFTGKESLDRFRSDLWSLFNDITEDELILQYFKDLRSFLFLGIENPQTIQSVQGRAHARILVDRGRLLTKQGGYRYRFRDLFDDAQILLDNIQKDSATQEFQGALQNLLLDVVGRQGDQFQPSLLTMNESLQQLKLIVLPVMKEYLNNLPIDRIEVKTAKYDASFENLVFSGVDILPDFFHFKLKNKFDIQSANLSMGTMESKLSFKLDHITPNIKGLKFWYHRKTIPRIEDYGVADVALDREGAKIKVVWKLVSSSGAPAVATLSSVRCTIDRLSVKIVGSETKHNILDKMLLTLMKGTIKRRLSEAVEVYLRKNINQLNERLNQFFETRPLDRIVQKGEQLLQQQSAATSL